MNIWPFNKNPKKEFYNVDHPDVINKVEEAFICKGVQYFRFKAELEMPYGRYKWVNAALNELDLRMDLKTLNAYLDELTGILNGKGGAVNLSNAVILIHKMKTRTALAFEPQMAKNLAAVVYFDKTEDVTTYDRNKGAEKLKIWEKAGTYDFFLTRPMVELLGLKGISIPSLESYILETSELLSELTSGQGNQSPAST